MAARKLVYWLLVLSPAILLLTVAIDSRYWEDPFVLPDDSPVQNERVAAYAAPVRAVAPLMKMSARDIDVERVEAVANYWIECLRGGYLQPLYATPRTESLADGVTSEIFAAKRRLALLLIEAAKRHIQAGRIESASADLLATIEIGEALKYADFQALAGSATCQQKALRLLEEMHPYLGADHRQLVAAHLTEFVKRQRPVARMLAIDCRHLLETTPETFDLSDEDRQELASLSSLLRQRRSTEKAKILAADVVGRCESAGAMLYWAEVRPGLDAQLSLEQVLTSVARMYRATDSSHLASL